MENTNQKESIEIDIKQIFYAILSKIGFVILAGVIAGVLAFSYYSFVATKQYQSTTQLYVINRSSDNLTSSDVAVSTSLSNDYVVLITTRPVLETVIAELGLDMSTNQLKSKINASLVTNSRIISITVTDPSPVLAKRIADCVANVSASRICTVMDSEMVNIVQEGEIADNPSSPAVMRNTIIAAILAIFVVCAIIVVKFILDDTISSTEDIEKYLGLNVIGTIPVFEQFDASLESEQTKAKK